MLFQAKSSEFEVIIRANKLDRQLTAIYLISTTFTAIGYCLTPIISNIYYHMIKGEAFIAVMPMKSAFIYDISVFPNYEITYFLFCLATYTTVLCSVRLKKIITKTKLMFIGIWIFRSQLILFSLDFV